MEKDKQSYINVGIGISQTVRSTLGPRGMNKMIIGKSPILTNDGATIIKNVNFNNPIGEIFKNLAKNQEDYIGDGTTTTVILAGQLLEKSLDLINKKIHASTIINGYNIARMETLRFLETLSFEANQTDIIKTAFGSKISPQMTEKLANLISQIDIHKFALTSLDNCEPDAELIEGYQFSGYTLNDRCPKIADGKIAVVDMQTNVETMKMTLNSADELTRFNDNNKQLKRQIVEKLKELGVKCVFLTDTNPQIENFFTENKIMTIVCYKRNEIDNVCRATGCRAISDEEADFEAYLGEGKVEYLQERQLIRIENSKSDIKTLIVKGATRQTLDETMRAIDDVVKLMRLDKKVVVGAGSTEIELALHLKKVAEQIGGKEQLAVEKFAESLEMIPMILAENCGFDAIEVLTLLKNQHSAGQKNLGVDIKFTISDALERKVFEPLLLKKHAINSATEVANLILKLDDIYSGEEQ
jgi:chaperonin GroEL (HSP60 family)